LGIAGFEREEDIEIKEKKEKKGKEEGYLILYIKS